METDAKKAGAIMAVTGALALLKTRKAKAAEGPVIGTVSLDDATTALLEAIAQANGETLEAVFNTLEELKGLSVNVRGYPANTDTIVSGRVAVTAVGTVTQLPDIDIPDDMQLQLKAWPTNAGLIYVGNAQSTAGNINQIWPLIANEGINYRVKNANAIYISGTAVGDWLAYTVEQRK